MRYGHFDDAAREYVIDRPDTPRAWTNYLGDTRYGAVITNHGGGYSFYKSAAAGRLLRFRTSAVPDGMPGRLFYLRDQDSGQFWSATWQPVGNVDGFSGYECRHGSAYTIIRSTVQEIESEATYFVPLGQQFEVWRLRVTNRSDRARTIGVTTYCEFTSDWSLQQDIVNVQYTAYIAQAHWFPGPSDNDNPILGIAINEHLPRVESGDGGRDEWMALIGSALTQYDTERDVFLGPWGTYARPDAIAAGKLGNSVAYGDTVCGALGTDLILAPGQTREICVLLGVGQAQHEGAEIVALYSDPAIVDNELLRLKEHWHSRLHALEVKTPDPAFDSMVNTWGIYNSLITFAWSRAASLVYNGERDGLGYRDTVQDILGVVAAAPEEACARLELMLSGQISTGGAMPVVRPFEHRPGSEHPTPEEEYRSDDCLWLFNTVPAYVAETGDLSFYRKSIPYADCGKATVLGHLRQALDFNLARVGAHGLPCGLAADWNDCLKLGYHGESIFVTFQVRYALLAYAQISDGLGETTESGWARQQVLQLDERIQSVCWDGGWFRWAIGEDGTVYGSKDFEEGQVYLNTQAWAVISGAATAQQAETCMDAVKARLATEFGLILCDPPFRKTDIEVMRAVLFNAGTKENAGIFSHPQSWAVMAECMLGRGDRAYEYHRAYLPAAQNDKAEIRQIEPYVHCQSSHGRHSPRFGRARLPWLTGAASWTYHSATQWILGIRPELAGLRIDPCIPSAWDGFEARRLVRGNTVRIVVRNPKHVCRGVAAMLLDGERIAGNIIAWKRLSADCRVDVELE